MSCVKGVYTIILTLSYSAQDIHKVVMQYTHILMCRDRIDGTLRGIMLFGIEHKRDHTLIKMGTASFKNYYRGSPFARLFPAYLAISELFKHPLTPIYFVGKVYSHRAYLVGMSLKEFYPVYNRETPEYLKKVFADFAAIVVSSKGGRAKYNPETFVIEQEDNYLKENLTALSEQDLQNPHIKFFVERNPGWKKVPLCHHKENTHAQQLHTFTQGHCLVMGGCVTWTDLILPVMKRILQQKNRSKSAKVQYLKFRLGGGQTFGLY